MTDIVFAKVLNGRYILDELTGLTDLDLFPADLAGSFRANDQAMLASGKAQSNEEWVTYPDGHSAWDPVLQASNGCQSCCVPVDC